MFTFLPVLCAAVTCETTNESLCELQNSLLHWMYL